MLIRQQRINHKIQACRVGANITIMFNKLFGKEKEESPSDSETITLEIEGMTCGSCATHVDKLVREKEGVVKADVSYPDGQGTFTFDASVINKDSIVEAINASSSYKVVNNGAQEISVPDSKAGNDDAEGTSYQYDLIIIGGGSAAFSAATTASELGKKSLLINGGLPIGGTCVNVGCVPSKYLIRAGESIHNASFSPFSGIKTNTPEVDFSAIIRQKKELVKTMQKKKYLNVAEGIEGLTILEGWAIFKDSHTVIVNDKEYSGSNFLIATGATTNIPKIEGLEEVGYLTNISLFDLEEKPDSLTILGAGYIGLEIAMAYNRLGVKVRILEFTDRVLRSQTPDISEELEKHMKNEGIEFYPNYRIESVKNEGENIIIMGKDVKAGESFEFTEPGHIVVATGTRPNTGKLGLDNIDLVLEDGGFIKVNSQMQTSLPHIYAAGDCTNTPAFVYTAAKEAKIGAGNALAGENKEVDYTGLPWVVFTDPQVSGAGIDEQEAEAKGIPFDTSIVPLSEVPRSAAALDTRGFIKLIRNPQTDKLIGARIIAPEGGELAMQASLAIKYGITVSELADSFHPYLTLSEGIKLAAITFNKDITELSCCAS